MTDVILDLFGEPVRPTREGPGRPEHAWSAENSNKINLLFATGGDLKDAAAALNISLPTLRKHYFSEVASWRKAQVRYRAKLLVLLNEQAEAGNVGAMKELSKRMDKAVLDQIAERVANRAPAAMKPPKLGKKAQQREAASNVGGRYAPGAPPSATSH